MAERRSPRQRPDRGPAIREALAADAIDGAHPSGPAVGRDSDSAGGGTADGGPRWSLVPDGLPAGGDGEPAIVDVAAAAVVLVPPSLEPVHDDPLAAALGLPPSPPKARPAAWQGAAPATRPGTPPAPVRARPAAGPRAPSQRPAPPRTAPVRPADIDLAGLRADTLPTGLAPVPPAAPPRIPPPPDMAPAADRWAAAADVERLGAEVADLRRRLAEMDDRSPGGRRESFEIVALIALVAVLVAVLVVRILKG